MRASYGCSIRHLERRIPVSGLERYPGCHPERSEGSLRPASQAFAEFPLSEAHGLRVTGILSKLMALVLFCQPISNVRCSQRMPVILSPLAYSKRRYM